jgi:hydrogenase/urease accessory protein HupE
MLAAPMATKGSRLTATVLPTLLGAALLTILAPPARAHDETVSASEVSVSDRQIVWRVDVGVAGLAKAVKLPAPEGELDERGLAEAKGAIAAYVAKGLGIDADGARLTASVGALEPRYEPAVTTGRPQLARAALELRYEAPRPVETIAADVRFFADLTTQHRAVINVRWAGEARRFVQLGPSRLELARGRLNPTAWTLAWDFGKWGTHHIFVGYDHIAFLLALLLAVTRFRELLAIVTSFTVAHSVTILLSALQIVTVPSRITEALIAASIVYVALENLLWPLRTARYRWLLTFAFGLVHGLGFATELRDRLAELGGDVVLPILAFNMGVEVGQVAIVCLVYPVLANLRAAGTDAGRALRRRRIAQIGSIPILVLGLYWLVERLSG